MESADSQTWDDDYEAIMRSLQELLEVEDDVPALIPTPVSTEQLAVGDILPQVISEDTAVGQGCVFKSSDPFVTYSAAEGYVYINAATRLFFWNLFGMLYGTDCGGKYSDFFGTITIDVVDVDNRGNFVVRARRVGSPDALYGRRRISGSFVFIEQVLVIARLAKCCWRVDDRYYFLGEVFDNFELDYFPWSLEEIIVLRFLFRSGSKFSHEVLKVFPELFMSLIKECVYDPPLFSQYLDLIRNRVTSILPRQEYIGIGNIICLDEGVFCKLDEVLDALRSGWDGYLGLGPFIHALDVD